ncbi:MAG: ABC transporter substrate-binding protein [Dehalococcoidia bacterium]|nr:MAG: ABC transporter substrate-binding protein [Dehalococcoidia bacterium]
MTYAFALRALGAATALVLLTSCAPAPAALPAAPDAPKAEQRAANQTFTIAQIGLPATLSPESSAANYAVYSALYDSLVRLDKSADAVPWAAERWDLVNGTTWRFTLRHGLVFGNGDPLTASDVAFTANAAIEGRWPIAGGFGNVAAVKAVDARTVDFEMKVADASILPGITALWILPERYYRSVGRDGFAAKPIGSGPYELVEFRNGDLARFRKKATEHLYRKAQPTELLIRSLPEQTAMLAGFRTGELDVLIGQLSPDVVDQAKAAGADVEVRHTGVNYALFSQTENRERNTPLNDRRVRLALNYAVDREAIAKTIYRGYAMPVSQFSVPDSLSWDESIKVYPYDPATAKRLLAEAGYPNGFKLPNGIEFTPQTTSPQVAAALQGYLRDIGVEAAVTSLELAVFLDKFYGRAGQAKAELFMVTSQAESAYGTNQRTTHDCQRPNPWWCNQRYQQLLEQAQTEPDRVRRSELMRQAIRIFADEVAHIDLIAVPQFVVQQPKVRGFVWEAANTHNFDTIYRID